MIRRSLGVDEDECLVYVGFGRAVDRMEAVVVSRTDLPFHILLPQHLNASTNGLYIPECTETQNYLAACDLVLSKAGYSTIAEAVAGHVPMLLLRRDEVPEDRSNLLWVEQAGFGEGVDEATLLGDQWVPQAISMLKKLDQYRMAYKAVPQNLDGARGVAEPGRIRT